MLVHENIKQEKVFNLDNDLDFSQHFKSMPLIKKFIHSFVEEDKNIYLQKNINNSQITFSLINEKQAEQNDFKLDSIKTTKLMQSVFKETIKINSPTIEDIKHISHSIINDEIDKVNGSNFNIKTKFFNSLNVFYNTLSDNEKDLLLKEFNVYDGSLNNIKEENFKPFIGLVNDNTKVIEDILNKTYKTTLFIHSLGEIVDDFYYLNSYLFELEKLLSDKCNNNDRKNIIENNLPKLEEEKSGFQLILEQNLGLNYDVLSDLEKTKLFKKNNEEFVEKLQKQFLEITEARNSFGVCVKMSLQDIIVIDTIQTGGLQDFYQSKTIDLINLKNNEIELKNVFGGIFSPCDGEGGLFNLNFKTLHVPLTNITPVVLDRLNNNWYVAEEVFTGEIKEEFYKSYYIIRENSVKNQINKMLEIENQKNINNKLIF